MNKVKEHRDQPERTPKGQRCNSCINKTNAAGIDDNPSQTIKLMFIINLIDLLQRRKEEREKEGREGRKKEGRQSRRKSNSCSLLKNLINICRRNKENLKITIQTLK